MEHQILRTANNGCFELYTGGWGTYLRRIDDPEANVIIDKNDLETFTLKEDIHRLPAELWQRWVQLCFHFVEKVPSDVEVSIRILRSEEDPSVYRIVVPKQKVSAASVRVDSFHDAIDIESGEEITQFPPIGWIPVGSSHSHNTMQAFFSGTDDKYELGDPGIHIVVGSIDVDKRTYRLKASVVANGRRFDVDHSKIIDCEPIVGATFHEDVLKYVDYTRPVVQPHKKATNFQSFQTKTNQRFSSYDYKSPFGFSDEIDFTDDYYQEFFGETEVTETKPLKLWQIEDVIEDYIKQNRGNAEEIQELISLLSVYVEEHSELTTQS